MRRDEREVNKQEDILAILQSCDCMRIGMIDGDEVYIVPVNFGFCSSDAKISLFFHGAQAGRKYELLKNGAKVGFEMDCRHELIANPVACAYSFKYSSVIGTGRVTCVQDEEKKEALQIIMNHYSNQPYEFSEDAVKSVCVFRVDVDKICGKAHL